MAKHKLHERQKQVSGDLGVFVDGISYLSKNASCSDLNLLNGLVSKCSYLLLTLWTLIPLCFTIRVRPTLKSQSEPSCGVLSPVFII